MHVADVECQTVLTSEDLVKQNLYLRDTISLQEELNAKLRSVQINEAAFANNEEKTKFYTGLPNFAILFNVFNLVFPYIKSNATTQVRVYPCRKTSLFF